MNYRELQDAMLEIHEFLKEHPRVRTQFSPFIDTGYEMRTSTWRVLLLPSKWREHASGIPEMNRAEWDSFSNEWLLEHTT